jgi:hypothetical protein
MKQHTAKKSLQFSKQTIQKLDGSKLAHIKAGQDQHTTTLILSAIASSGVSTALCTIGCLTLV